MFSSNSEDALYLKVCKFVFKVVFQVWTFGWHMCNVMNNGIYGGGTEGEE